MENLSSIIFLEKSGPVEGREGRERARNRQGSERRKERVEDPKNPGRSPPVSGRRWSILKLLLSLSKSLSLRYA
jgi:hypothetical protein